MTVSVVIKVVEEVEVPEIVAHHTFKGQEGKEDLYELIVERLDIDDIDAMVAVYNTEDDTVIWEDEEG